MKIALHIVRVCIFALIIFALWVLSAAVPFWIAIKAMQWLFPVFWITERETALTLSVIPTCALWWIGYWAMTLKSWKLEDN
jgi:hypothetical protein